MEKRLSNPFGKLMHKAFYACSENAELIEKHKIFGVDSITRIRMDLHFIMCKHCRAYRSHSDLIDRMIQFHAAQSASMVIDTSILKKNIIDETIGKV